MRRHAESAAEQALARAVSGREGAEREQRRLEECAAAARVRVGAIPYDGPGSTAAAALEIERFRARLAGEVRRADAKVLTHRKGRLRAARVQEETAGQRHAAARRDREALEQVQERQEAERRRVASRRAEDAASDLTAARRRG
jgi:hypothetical protein